MKCRIISIILINLSENVFYLILRLPLWTKFLLQGATNSGLPEWFCLTFGHRLVLMVNYNYGQGELKHPVSSHKVTMGCLYILCIHLFTGSYSQTCISFCLFLINSEQKETDECMHPLFADHLVTGYFHM